MKEKFISLFNDKISPAVDNFSSNRIVKAIQAGMTAPMGITVIGSIFAVLMVPPVSGEASGFMLAWQIWAKANASWLNMGYSFTMNSISLFALIGLVIALATQRKKSPTNLVIMSVVCFFIVCSNVAVVEGVSMMSTDWLSAKGLFSAIIIGIAVVEITCFLQDKGIKIKLPEAVPSNVAEPLENLFVNMIVVGLAVALHVGLSAMGYTLPVLINSLFAPLLSTGDTLGALLMCVFVERLLWFFGIHGASVVMAVMTPIWTSNLAANIEAYAAGQNLPFIYNTSFAQCLVNVGMLPLCLALLLCAKSAQLKTVSRVAIGPAIFCIGEPIVFGVPIVLNFKLLIPYMSGYLLDAAVFFLATQWGFMNRAFVGVPFTIPGPFKAFLATMDIRATIIWTVLIIINVLMYIPFLKSYDRELLANEQGELKNE